MSAVRRNRHEDHLPVYHAKSEATVADLLPDRLAPCDVRRCIQICSRYGLLRIRDVIGTEQLSDVPIQRHLRVLDGNSLRLNSLPDFLGRTDQFVKILVQRLI